MNRPPPGIHYEVRDVLDLPEGVPVIIAHVCNDIGVWGGGFTRALDRRWRGPRSPFLAYYEGYNSSCGLLPGTVWFANPEDNVWVANMVAQAGVRSPSNPKPIKYGALEEALDWVGKVARRHPGSQTPWWTYREYLVGKTGWNSTPEIHMPRIGCGLAGGTWEEVEPILQRRLGGLVVVVCDLPVAS